jgi:adenine-specific DNA-methyltransferase
MASLQWIGKEAVVGHHREVPYRLLRGVPELSVGEDGGVGSGNLLVQGDNLLALKALLPYYANRVKCIYIDPPYNTGNEKWAYNDNVNSPEIRRWLGDVVKGEGETLDRHDRWLCMMYPRLALLKEFLTEDGAIFVSIDDTEFAMLRLMTDEVFGYRNYLGTLVWKSRTSSAMRGTPLSVDHEYVAVYGKDIANTRLYGLAKGADGYPHEDDKGRFASTDLTIGMTSRERPGQFYTITNPRTGKQYPANPERVWRFFPETMDGVIAKGLVIWPDEAEGRMTRPRYKTYWDPKSEKPLPLTSWIESASTNQPRMSESEVEGDDATGRVVLTSALTQEGGRVLSDIFGTKSFAYPKPPSLIQSIVRCSTGPNDLIMDSFAGSGTTGHAVLAMNKADGGNRRFICVEMDYGIATTITAQRLRKVAEGYQPLGDAKKERVEATGGGFRFVTLGEPLFNERGQVRAEVKFADLAAHVFFTETGEPLPGKVNGKRSPLIGACRGTAYYLLFNGILGDRRPDSGNVLTGDVLAELPKHDGPRVVFGEACRLGAARLKREGVTFRQIPYQIKVS